MIWEELFPKSELQYQTMQSIGIDKESKMNILGINAAFHESAACLVVDGQVVMAIEEERINRIKHGKLASPGLAKLLPWASIKLCLERKGLSLQDIDYVGFSFDPKLLQDGVTTWRETGHVSISWPLESTSYQTREGGLVFLDGILSAQPQLRDAGFRGEFIFLPHHDCHAASAFLVSPFDDAAVLVVDGIGEWASTTMYLGEGRRLRKVDEFLFPNSLGFVWEKLSAFLGFDRYDASKVMGLAAYGTASNTRASFAQLIHNIDSFEVDLSLLRHESPDFTPLEKLFSLKRRTSPLDFDSSNWSAYVDIAAGLQQVTEEVLIGILRRPEFARSEYLCLAGGVALNCAANGTIVDQALFKDVFVQPASHDAGTAMGAAFLIWNSLLGHERNYVLDHAFLGPEYSDEAIESVLQRTKLKYERLDIAKVAARLIADGKIVGWFNGRMEWGPRALGNRSLLAHPGRADIRELMNVKVKHRERFRPFCPSILAEKAEDWLHLDRDIDVNKYMLRTAKIRPEKANLVPAVIHEDQTVRPQIVREKDNPLFYRLISEFDSITGLPLLLNTSFNDSEPIVCSPQDAINTFFKTGIDYLALGSFLVSRYS